MSCFKPEEPRYGAWLSTTVCRSWDETLVALNMDEVEAQFVRRKREEAEKRKEEQESMKANTETFAADDDLFCIRINDPVPVAQKRDMDEVRRVKERITKVSSEGVINKRENYSRRQVIQGSNGGASNTSACMDELGAEGKPEGVNSEVAKSNLVAGGGAQWDKQPWVEKGGSRGLGSKRRRCEEKRPNPLANISNYASNLRKAKAKVRKSNRKKGTVMQENIPAEGELQDREMEESDEYAFIFRAGCGKRKEASAVGWNEVEGDAENRLTDLVRRLEACKKKLVTWSKRTFPNFKKLIEQLKRKLDRCNIGILNEQVVREAEEVTRELEEAWAHEEVYWWQRSRISWLKCGDKNTNFFHINVIQRRQRNKLSWFLADRASCLLCGFGGDRGREYQLDETSYKPGN
ncbi:hypothetical protein K1719_026725 [Acacia pycnantha]|nr:hypothetical protein K1719_026725 [Acacia pycnantha]